MTKRFENQPGAPRISVGVVDDHEMFRTGVISTIQGDFEIAGQAGDVESAVAMIARTHPDVVLLDVHVPGGQGGEVPRLFCAASGCHPRPSTWRCRCLMRLRTWVPSSARALAAT